MAVGFPGWGGALLMFLVAKLTFFPSSITYANPVTVYLLLTALATSTCHVISCIRKLVDYRGQVELQIRLRRAPRRAVPPALRARILMLRCTGTAHALRAL
jgi:hypothetical protein